MPVTVGRDFAKRWRGLLKAGKRAQYTKVNSAFAESQTEGKIHSLSRTIHGESRLPHVEKYDLGDGYRLVVQVVDPTLNHRVFLFVGTHDETEAWLMTHTNYKYIQRSSDQQFSFVPVSDEVEDFIIPPPSESLTDEQMEVSILSRLSSNDWEHLGVPVERISQLSTITAESTLEGALEMLEEMPEIGDSGKSAIFDLVSLALENNWDGFQRRMELSRGEAVELSSYSMSEALLDVPTSDEFITFEDDVLLDDFKNLAGSDSWREWLTFLHPSQHKLVVARYNGPARIRGVSGSGKTCIAVHRARMLAKRYNQLVFMVTFNKSLKELLRQLTTDLCGREQQHIHHYTIQELARGVLREFTPRSEYILSVASEEFRKSFLEKATDAAASPPTLVYLLRKEGRTFVEEEVSYIRSRYLPSTRAGDYLAGSRIGRRVPLNREQRELMLDIVEEYERSLNEARMQDYEGIVIQAVEHLKSARDGTSQLEYTGMPRCVVADEVQDFSENELKLLHLLVDDPREDNLFLVGDGAQKIYQRGFSLKNAGIDVTGRSKILKKNYRNTRQIIEAAHKLISNYDCDDLDSESVGRPEAPDFPTREGTLPRLVKFRNEDLEVDWVCGEIESLTKNGGVSPGEVLVLAGSPRIRSKIMSALENRGIESCGLREDVAVDSTRVKVSTIESAKGHECPQVFVAGVVEGIVPWHNVDGDGERLHASRLYVAMTRARDCLTLSWSAEGEDGQPQNPSRYLNIIQGKCQEYVFRSNKLFPSDSDLDKSHLGSGTPNIGPVKTC